MSKLGMVQKWPDEDQAIHSPKARQQADWPGSVGQPETGGRPSPRGWPGGGGGQSEAGWQAKVRGLEKAGSQDQREQQLHLEMGQ